MTNKELFTLAQTLIPGGVNSPVRSFQSVNGVPFFTHKAKDCYLYDVTGKRYIDYVCSWGANIVGHANEYVNEQITKQLSNGLSFGTASELEVQFALKLQNIIPHLEKIRLVSSGTEAVMTAIRLARGYTKRKYIIKFAGCYHGHSNNLLVAAGSGLATLAQPNSAGITLDEIKHTLVINYNAVDQLQEAFANYGDDIAAVIVEPIVGNMNMVRPTVDFMLQLRQLCTDYSSLLIFDEVITGFRVALGGAADLLQITPDLTIFGKIIGGGLPLAAFGGRADVMDYLAPVGEVYQAGTLSGNPVAVSCGLANLNLLLAPNFYQQLNNNSHALGSGLQQVAVKHGIDFSYDAEGGLFGIYFNQHLPQNLAAVQKTNNELFSKFFHGMLSNGVFFAPSFYEAGFINITHSIAVIEQTIEIADCVFATIIPN